MKKEVISTDLAPAPGGHYSQAVRAGNEIYVSGSGPFDPKTHAMVAGGIEEQTARTLMNVAAVLEAAGSSLRDVVKVTVYLKDMDDFKAMDSVYKGYFPSNPPARTTVQAVLYGNQRLIVIDAIAHVP
jgi:2-iminobutanoate/2-iminopropanoate deaminase